MKIKILGLGAAGNKGAINLIEKGILESEQVVLINSTLKDVPADYRSLAFKFSNSVGGCGKERELAKELALSSINDGSLSILDEIIDPDDEAVVIVISTEGGTGCGSAPIIAQYMKDVIGINVIVFAFTGFEEDGRGLQNTVEFFQELREDYTVIAISNKKFLEGTNKFKAEKAANDEFAERVKVLIGYGIVDSEQNIDQRDHYKTATTPGFMTINKAKLNKIKNVEQFNKILIDTIDNDKSLETSKGTKRLAVFINANDDTTDNIDFNFNVIREKLGVPYEVFTHAQYNPEEGEYISFIASGMKMPTDEVKQVYAKYQQESEKVDKEKDQFFGFASQLRGNKDDNMFNTSTTSRGAVKDKSAFLKGFNKDVAEKKEEKVEESKSPRTVTLSKDDLVNKY